MTESLFAQTVATATGLLMLTAVLQVWRRSTDASTKLLAVQGAALALLVGAIGLAAVSYTHLDVYKRQGVTRASCSPRNRSLPKAPGRSWRPPRSFSS